MGLDQYLYKKTYVKNWEHMKPEGLHKITVTKGGKTVSHIKPERITYIVEEVAYWRKANQIHKWFVDNVQDGEDNCKEYYVDSSQMKDLLALVNRVINESKLIDGKVNNGYRFKDGKEEAIMEDGKLLKDPTLAHELLPTADGFFFGGTDYDEYYMEQLIYTRDRLTEILAEDDEHAGEYYYDSSW